MSFVVEADDKVYWFDAGEGCSYAAHLMGIDLLAVRAIFISHCHIDHIGGLENLVFNMGKLNNRSPQAPKPLEGREMGLFIPDMSVWEAAKGVLAPTGSVLMPGIQATECCDGELFNDGTVRVNAIHNRHMGEPEPGDPWRSFSYGIETGARKAVYSGDVRHVSELMPILDDCDALLMETGHHKVEEVCSFLKDCGKCPRQLVFVHHGRAILADAEAEAAKARDILGDRVRVAEDGMTLTPGG